MDSMSSGTKAPHQEYLLQGTIHDDSSDILIHRLRGLCENYTKFHNQESVYSIKNAVGGSAVNIRLRRSLNPEQTDRIPWKIFYLGQPEIGDRNRQAMVRTHLDISCSEDAKAFVEDLGFKLDYEYTSQGWLFRKGRMRAIVSKIKHTDNTPVTTSHLVELSMVSPTSNEQVASDMHAFAEQLRPLVSLDKVDHNRVM
ncbi:Mediator of RNA polymerase II transcription subunit 18, partial [Fragariocoptes setiger]